MPGHFIRNVHVGDAAAGACGDPGIGPQVYRDVQLAVPSLKEASLAAKLFIEMAKDLFGAE